jgi:uncharacterized protein (TIGR01568 family)
MEKNRFRLCDMMPNSWLYKLRDMAKPGRIRNSSKTSKKSEDDISKLPKLEISQPFQPNLQNYVPNRASQYLPSRERLGKSCKLLPRPIKLKPKSKPTSLVSVHKKSPGDIVFEIGPRSPELKLRPILTKPRCGASRIKVRPISPRCNSRVKQRRWMSDSYLVVKHSRNPEKDFMESMVEMVVEKNIVSLKDLEELLACYLSLNSREYQDVIVKVFQKIWLLFFQANLNR